MKQRLLNLQTLLLAAGSVLVVGTVVAIARKVSGPPVQQFMLFQNLPENADPLEYARLYMGPEVVQTKGFFSYDFRVPGNPDVIGMVS